MKFDNRTVQVLRNFSTINPSLVFKRGSTISTISPGKAVIAVANVQPEFPQDFAIYDLGNFLNVISLFEDPTLDFGFRCFLLSGLECLVLY